MTRKKNKKDNDNFLFTIYTIIVLAAIFTEFVNYRSNNISHTDFFSIVIGLTGWFGMYMNSQKIINNNLFKQFTFIGLAIMVVCTIKQALTTYNQLALFTAALPLLFIGFFRLLTFVFFSDYPAIRKKPAILLFTKTGYTRLDNSYDGYNPNLKERFFSLLLSIGFMSLAFSAILLLRNIL